MCLLCGRHHDNFIAVSEHAKSHKGYQLANKSLAQEGSDNSEATGNACEMAFVKTEIDYDEYGEEETELDGSDLMQQEDDEQLEGEYSQEDSFDGENKRTCKEEHYDEAGTSRKAIEDDVVSLKCLFNSINNLSI